MSRPPSDSNQTSSTHDPMIEALHAFWFGPGDLLKRWFAVDPEADRLMKVRFEAVVDKVLAGDEQHWTATPRGSLALLIALDQLPRNLYRGQAKAFAGAQRAEQLAAQSIDRGFDQQVPWIERAFFYLPLEHAEDLQLQERSVTLFEALRAGAPSAQEAMAKRFVDAALRHRDCVARLGRFPARNQALGRETTAQERAFLRDHPAGF